MQYEGPYDFHTETEMSKLLSKLQHIRAKGGEPPESLGVSMLIPILILLASTVALKTSGRAGTVGWHRPYMLHFPTGAYASEVLDGFLPPPYV